MNNLLRQIFGKAIVVGGKLHDNLPARALFYRLEAMNFNLAEFSANDLLGLVASEEPVPDPDISQPSSEVSDKRFRILRVRGVRFFPADEANKKLCYSLCFSEKEADGGLKPVSCVFLGENGIGKTSMYAALEWLALGVCNTALLRGVKENDYAGHTSYLCNLSTGIDRLFATIHTGERTLRISVNQATEQLDPLPSAPEAFFCSEWDIRRIEPLADLGEFIYDQCSLADYILLIDLLESELTRIAKLKEEYEQVLSRFTLLQDEMYSYDFVARRRMKGFGAKQLNKELNLIARFYLLGNVVKPHSDESLSQFCKYFGKLYGSYISYSRLCAEILPNSVFSDAYREFRNCGSQVVASISECRCKGHTAFASLIASVDSLNSAIDRIHTIQQSRIDKENQLVEQYDKDKKVFRRLYSEVRHQYRKYEAYISDERFESYKTVRKDYDKWREGLLSVHDFLKEEFIEMFGTQFKSVIKPVVEGLMNDYMADDELRLEVVFIEDNLTLKVMLKHINTDNEGKDIEPRIYFNTFRFKLFCVVLKVAIAVGVKKIYGENWPIVIDDVFDSSDFNNRSRMDRFIERIVELHNGCIDKNRFPLQLILFTQDDLIGEAVYRGLNHSGLKARISRIQHYSSFRQQEYVSGFLSDQMTDCFVCDLIQKN